MNDSYPQSFITNINKYDMSFVNYLIENYSQSELLTVGDFLASAWAKYAEKNSYKGLAKIPFLLDEIVVLNMARPLAENTPSALAVCDAIEAQIIQLLKDALQPSNFTANSSDPFFCEILKNYCISVEPEDGSSKELWCGFFDEHECDEQKNDPTLPHITTPFIIMLLRYTYYHNHLHRIEVDADYRRQLDFIRDYDFTEVTKVNWGKYSKQEVCEQYILSRNGGALNEIGIGYYGHNVEKVEDIPHHWFLTLVEAEGRRFQKDCDFLKTHFNRRFVASLMEWHRYYYDYLVECLHNCEEYKDYPIEKLVPMTKIPKPKRKTIEEPRALTPLGMSCRKAIIAKIRECRTTADFGALLYKFQYELKFFTKGVLSQNECYLCMQQMGKVHFDSSGDFSNCNKGYNLAMNRASKK